MKFVYIALIVLIIIAVIYAAFVFSQSKDKNALPRYASVHPLIREAYIFAVENSTQLDGVNCYCGCMQHPHNGRIHSRGLLDCFMTSSGDFDRHASECDMCIKDALEVKKLAGEEKAKNEIMAYIDSKYIQ